MSRIPFRRPSKRWLVVPPLLIGLAVVVALAQSRRELPREPVSEQSLSVETVTVQPKLVQQSVVGYGSARPKRIWAAVAEVGGRILDVHPRFESGHRIEQGETLLQIDPADYDLRIRQRAAELEQARAQLQQIQLGAASDRKSLEIQQNLLDVKRQDMERLQQLRGSRAASQTESDMAQSAYLNQALAVETLRRAIDLSQAQASASEAAIELAEARVIEANRDRERTQITAPLSGLLVDADLQAGQYVASGQQLFQIHGTDVMEVEAQYSLAQLSELIISDSTKGTLSEPREFEAEQVLGQLAAAVTVRSGNVDVTFDGAPVRVSASIDGQTRTLGVVVEIDDYGRLGPDMQIQLRSGAYCEVALMRRTPEPHLVIPRTAIREGSVFLVDAERRLRRQSIQIVGNVVGGVIVSGLRPGEELLVNPPNAAAEGMRIRSPGASMP